MKLLVAFQVMMTTESLIATFAGEWLFLAMSEKVAFEVVVTSEFSGAVWTFVFLG